MTAHPEGSREGLRGCAGRTKRRGTERACAQTPIVTVDGRQWCYYHNPDRPRKFGQGYDHEERRRHA